MRNSITAINQEITLVETGLISNGNIIHVYPDSFLNPVERLMKKIGYEVPTKIDKLMKKIGYDK